MVGVKAKDIFTSWFNYVQNIKKGNAMRDNDEATKDLKDTNPSHDNRVNTKAIDDIMSSNVVDIKKTKRTKKNNAKKNT